MKIVGRFLTVLFVGFLFVVTANSQPLLREYWRNVAVPIPDNGPGVTSVVNVGDNFNITDMQVIVDIKHPSAGDLVITLTSPANVTYAISTNNGGINANFENTIFDNTGGYPGYTITTVQPTAFYRGVYKPESTLPTSGSALGNWTLTVKDNYPVFSGVLRNFGLIFNQGHKYRDIRWGADLNALGTAMYPMPYLDDIGLYPPMTVTALRPWGNQALYSVIYQNSKDQVPTRLSVQTMNAIGGYNPREDFDQILATGAYGRTNYVNLNPVAGIQPVAFSLYQRGDLFMTMNDNTQYLNINTTKGSMAYDNGVAAGEFDPGVLECNGNGFFMPTSNKLTSVDIWQGNGVELDPAQSANWQIFIKVYEMTNVTNPTLFATFGPYPLVKQGSKWVTYAVPPTMIPAGWYGYSVCIGARPGVGGGTFSLGVDKTAKPFMNPLSSLSRLSGAQVQYYNIDPAVNPWSEEVDRDFAVKMIRPNFNEGTDVGVVEIVSPVGTASGTVTPQVKFGSYIPFPSPTMTSILALAKVSFYNTTTNALAGYTEKRVSLSAPTTTAPYAYYGPTETFPGVTLGAGTYTMKVEIERHDDENLVNNVYTRTLAVTAAPIVVNHNGAMSRMLRDKISSGLQGFDVQFIDRSLNSEIPANSDVLWVGDVTANDAARLRSIAAMGSNVAVMTPDNARGDFRTQIFAAFANSDEAADMYQTLANAGTAVYTPTATNAFSTGILSNDPKVHELVADVNRVLGQSQATRTLAKDATKRELAFTRSGDLEVAASSFGTLPVVEVRVAKTGVKQNGVENSVKPTNFTLAQNYPNPFNPTTNISYTLSNDAQVSIRVFDMLGREIAVLANTAQNAGQYTITWNGVNASTGIYLYRMEARPLDGSAPFIATRKMVLAK